jgi:hypothetical protein
MQQCKSRESSETVGFSRTVKEKIEEYIRNRVIKPKTIPVKRGEPMPTLLQVQTFSKHRRNSMDNNDHLGELVDFLETLRLAGDLFSGTHNIFIFGNQYGDRTDQ